MKILIMAFCGEGSRLYKLRTNLFMKIISSLVINLGYQSKERSPVYLKSRKQEKPELKVTTLLIFVPYVWFTM